VQIRIRSSLRKLRRSGAKRKVGARAGGIWFVVR
jgi:hypothetical protein